MACSLRSNRASASAAEARASAGRPTSRRTSARSSATSPWSGQEVHRRDHRSASSEQRSASGIPAATGCEQRPNREELGPRRCCHRSESARASARFAAPRHPGRARSAPGRGLGATKPGLTRSPIACIARCIAPATTRPPRSRRPWHHATSPSIHPAWYIREAVPMSAAIARLVALAAAAASGRPSLAQKNARSACNSASIHRTPANLVEELIGAPEPSG